MQEKIKVAVDAMGGDNAPVEPIKAAVEAVNENPDIRVVLVGKEEVIQSELKKYTYDPQRIEITNASEVIETGEPPVNAIRKKKGFIHCSWNEYGKAWGGRCDYILGKYRCCSGWRTGDRRKNQRCGETSACTADSDREGSTHC